MELLIYFLVLSCILLYIRGLMEHKDAAWERERYEQLNDAYWDLHSEFYDYIVSYNDSGSEITEWVLKEKYDTKTTNKRKDLTN